MNLSTRRLGANRLEARTRLGVYRLELREEEEELLILAPGLEETISLLDCPDDLEPFAWGLAYLINLEMKVMGDTL